MFYVLAAVGAAGEPHGDTFAAFAFDVVTDDGRTQEAAAGARGGTEFVRVVEHRPGVGRRAGGRRGCVLLGRLPVADGVLFENFVLVEEPIGIGHNDDDLAFAVGAEAFLAGVLVFDFELMPVGAFDLNSHVRLVPPNLPKLPQRPVRDWTVDRAQVDFHSALTPTSASMAIGFAD